MILRQPSHLAGHFPGGLAADTGVDLVKNKAVNIVLARKYGLEGKHDPGEFAAAGDLFERPQGFSGIHGNMHGNVVPAFRTGMVTVGLYLNGKFHTQEIEVKQGFFHAGCKLCGGLLAGGSKLCAGILQLLAGTGNAGGQFFSALVIGLQKFNAVEALLQGVHNVGYGGAVFVLAASDDVQAVLDLLEAPGIKGKAVHVVGKTSVEIRKKAVDLG